MDPGFWQRDISGSRVRVPPKGGRIYFMFHAAHPPLDTLLGGGGGTEATSFRITICEPLNY